MLRFVVSASGTPFVLLFALDLHGVHSGVDGFDLSTIGRALSENRYNELQVP